LSLYVTRMCTESRDRSWSVITGQRPFDRPTDHLTNHLTDHLTFFNYCLINIIYKFTIKLYMYLVYFLTYTSVRNTGHVIFLICLITWYYPFNAYYAKFIYVIMCSLLRELPPYLLSKILFFFSSLLLKFSSIKPFVCYTKTTSQVKD